MALLSFRGISTPSLKAQGEQRRSSLFNIPRDIPRTAFWLLVYSAFAILAAYVLGAVRGAGAETMRQAATGANGSAFQEAAIMVVAYSSAPTGLVAFALILWGLCGEGGKAAIDVRNNGGRPG